MSRMFKYCSFFIMLVIIGSVSAAGRPIFNKIVYQMAEQGWVITHNAEVSVTVDAAMPASKTAAVYQEILSALNKLVPPSRWYITNIQRNQNQAGLEQLHLTAMARVPQSVTNDLREKLNALNKSGIKYQLSNVDASPDLTTIEATKARLRLRLLQQVNRQLAMINKLYPGQHYFIHLVSFVPMSFANRQANRINLHTMVMPQTPQVGNKLQVNAIVVFAARSQNTVTATVRKKA